MAFDLSSSRGGGDAISIVSAQTGHPYTILTDKDNGRNGAASFSWPDVIGNPFANSGSRITANGVVTGASNLAAFTPETTFLGISEARDATSFMARITPMLMLR